MKVVEFRKRCIVCNEPQDRGHEPFCKNCHGFVQDKVIKRGINIESAKGRLDLHNKTGRKERRGD